MTPDVPCSRDVSTLVDRLAWKLGRDTVTLVGCASRELVVGVTTPLACFDREEHTSYASALRPLRAVGTLDSAARAISPLGGTTLPVIAATVLSDLAGDLSVIGAANPAMVVVGDPEGGRAQLVELLARLRASNLGTVHGDLLAAEGSATGRRACPVVVVASHDARTLLDTGLQSLRLDPEVDTLTPSNERARVCIVSYEVVGPVRNGGIGTANTSLALRLADAGHDVSLLFTATPPEGSERDRWRAFFASRNVSYDELDPAEVDRIRSPHINVRRAWAAYEWVRRAHAQAPFDVIHAPECQGHGAFIALAKRHGVAFTTSDVAIGVHSSTRWCAEANRHPLTTLDSVADDDLERTSVEAADVVISPSAYMLGYLRSRGWRLPRRSFVQQYARSEAVLAGAAAPPPPTTAKPSELVFFGRLEKRKGLGLFCAALDLMAESGEADGISVTFLGSEVTIDDEPSRQYVERRAQKWPWPLRIETGFTQPEAVEYLRTGSRLAVMPSLVDNSPNTVYESLALGIPFVAARSGGTGELIALDDLDRCSFEVAGETDVALPVPADERPPRYDAGSLAFVISRALTQPATAVRRAIDAESNDAVHVAWHVAAAAEARRRRTRPAGDDVGPDVSLVTGEPTNVALSAASGELLMVVPEDVIPHETASATVRLAAASSRVDVLLLATQETSDGGRPSPNVPVAGPAVLALSYPCFGDFFAIRADAFRQLGGIDEALSVSERVTDLIVRAKLAGLLVEVLPEVLGERTLLPVDQPGNALDFWLEAAAWSGSGEEHLARLRPFVRSVERQDMADLPGLLRGGQELLARFRADHHGLAARWDEIYQGTVAYGRDLQAHTDRLQQQYDDTLAWAQETKAALDHLRAHSEHAQQAYDDQVARAESLERALAEIRASTSWRITAPMRRLMGARLRWRGVK